MLVSASSTARVMDLQCSAGNPSVPVRRSTAARTIVSHLGLLYSAIINNKPPRCPGFRSWPLLVVGQRNVFMCHSGCLLGEVVGSLEISTEEPDLAVYIPLQEGSPVRPRELAMNRDGGRAGNGCHLPGPLTACFESSDGAMKNNEVGDPNRIAVAIAIDMLESPTSLFFIAPSEDSK